MSALTMSAEPHTATRPRPSGGGLPTLFRRIAIALYLAVLAYAVVVGFTSVIPQVFSPSASNLPAVPAPPAGTPGVAALTELGDSRDCDAGLATLHASLWEASGASVADGVRPGAAYFRAWDDAARDLLRHCEGQPATGALLRLRYRLETTWDRFDRDEGALRRRLDALLIDD